MRVRTVRGLLGRNRQTAWGAVLALSLFAASCSSGDDPAPRGAVQMGDAVHIPLELQAQNPRADEAEVENVVRLVPKRGIEPWQTVARKARFQKETWLKEKGGPAKPALILDDAKNPKQVSIPIEARPCSDFNQVTLVARVFKRDNVQVFLKNKGRAVAVSEAISVAAGEATAVTYRFPDLRRNAGVIDEVLVRVDGVSGAFVFFEAILQDRPIATFLPTGQPDVVSIRPDTEDARRGVGVSTENPLVAETEIGPDMELAFSYGIPEELRLEPAAGSRGPKKSKGSGRATLVLELTREGKALYSERYPLEKSASERSAWHGASVDLSEFGEGPLEVTYSLEVDSELEGLCLIAEARLLSRGSRAPAVLLITSDTHRADHLGTAGDLVVTPVLDALAARGVLFEDCYSASNVTNPSHVSIMTAVNPRDTRIVNNRSPLLGGADTLAEGFRAGGYRTFAALSAHHLMHTESGLGQGFERMSAPRKADRDSSETLDVLEEWLEEAAGEPLFVWLHIFDAHSPYEPPGSFADRYWQGGDPKDPSVQLDLDERLVPKFLEGLREVEFPYSQYRGEVDYLDKQMARVLEHPRFSEATVAFTADHGESFGQHGVYWDHAELYPDTVHIPLILTWPGSPTGERVQTPVSVLDVGRTLLDIAGLESAPLGGRDLRATLDDTFDEEPRFLMSAHGFSAAVNSGNWHLILHLRKHHQAAVRDPRAEHQVELYNLRTDPGCEANLVEEEFERAKRMRDRLVRWLGEAQDLSLMGTGTQTREGQEGLEALGYTESAPVESGAWIDADHACEWCDRFR